MKRNEFSYVQMIEFLNTIRLFSSFPDNLSDAYISKISIIL